MPSSPTFQITRLQSGGLITNYFCTSRCRHCLYNCGPDWPKEFITPQTAEKNFEIIRSSGCRAVHIGGGEPLLRPEALIPVLNAAARIGVQLEYVETNSAWYGDADAAVDLLTRLKRHGLHTLLVSISPFHNEYISFARIEGVMAAARRAGIGLFPWVEGFVADLRQFDRRQTHRLAEYQARFGRDYLRQVLHRYWIHPGGRALNTFRGVLGPKPIARVLDDSCAAELSDTRHFHMDLFGNYIPGLCAGLAIAGDDLGAPLRPGDYPILQRLYAEGIRGLLEWAQQHYGFQPMRSGYINKCDLCTEIRVHLCQETEDQFRELAPGEFYRLPMA